MSELAISAIERTEKPNKVRKDGFIPGIIFGKDMESKNIKMEQNEFKKMLHGHTKNAKINVKFGNETKKCIIKDIQKDPINGQILHVELRTVHNEDVIRLKVPIIFHGRERLAGKQQLLQDYVSEVEIMGEAAIMPESVIIDVGERKPGDKLTSKDIQVGAGVKVMESEDETIAIITAVKEQSESEEG